MSDFEKFKEELHSKEKFYSSLKKQKKYRQRIWSCFKSLEKLEIKTIKDYRDMYLKCDVLLLADLFEKFRNISLKNYGLCPSHYLGAVGLSWDTMLKIAKVDLELIPDLDMYIFFEKSTRGGNNKTINKYTAKPSINI